MFNKQKAIKFSVFFIIIFTLLINLIGFGYVEYCREYTLYNNEIAITFNKNKNQETKTEDYKEACLKLKPNLLIPATDLLGYWSGLMILISIATMIVVMIGSVVFRKKIFCRKEKYILLSAILLSFIILFHISLIELNFYYWTWDCSQFF